MSLNRIQNNLQTLFTDDRRWPHNGRRLVFWYDADGQFQESFDELSLEGIEKIQLADTPFYTKYRLLMGDPEQNFLLYAPFAEPAPMDNWLLDLQLSGLSFAADQAALLYADLGFHDRHLENVIRQYPNFFNSNKRTAAIAAMQLAPDTTEKTLLLALLCAIAGLKVPDTPVLIRHIFMKGLLESDNELWQEITRLLSAETFWQIAQDYFHFQDDKPSLKKILTRLLITHLGLSLQGQLPETLRAYRLQSGQQAYAFIDQWLRDQRDLDAFKDFSRQIGDDLQIFQPLETLSTETLQEAATFEAIDQVIIRQCVGDILTQSKEISHWRGWLPSRRTLPWFDKYQAIYDALLAAITLIELYGQYKAGFPATASQLFSAYTQDLYRFDQAYRQFIVASDAAIGDVLKPVIEQIEGLYVNGYLAELGEVWSDSLGQTWSIEGVSCQSKFFATYISPILKRSDREKVFVIISDALRYEVAAELKDQIEKELRGEILLTSQLSLLPSVTRLGMAALLPGTSLNLIPESNEVKRDGLSTLGAEARQKVLEQNSQVSSKVLSSAEILDSNTEQGRELIKPHRLFYIYQDVIDAIGDKAASEREVFTACTKANQQILRLVKRLCNSLNGTHVIITADHGFLYQRRSIEEPDKLPLPKADDIIKTNRRYVLRSQAIAEKGTVAFPVPSDDREVTAVIPRGSMRFAVQGAGSQYVHGGASLQEVCVPVITYRHKRAEKGDDGPIQKVGVQINARTRKVTNNRFRVSLIQSDAAIGRWRSRTVTLGLYDSVNGQALTDIKTIELSSSSPNPSEREFPQNLTVILVNPPSSASLIIRDADDDEELLRETWTVDLAIQNLFGDF